jgi:hypothetical protein
MRSLRLTFEQMRVVMAALERYVTEEQKLADEQGLEATADQETAEGILDMIEDGLPASLP